MAENSSVANSARVSAPASNSRSSGRMQTDSMASMSIPTARTSRRRATATPTRRRLWLIEPT
nr:hypothetical protein [Achromobacter ruhlandii]